MLLSVVGVYLNGMLLGKVRGCVSCGGIGWFDFFLVIIVYVWCLVFLKKKFYFVRYLELIRVKKIGLCCLLL